MRDIADYCCSGANGGFVTLDNGSVLANGGGTIIRSLFC
jgi:hypothetical protein